MSEEPQPPASPRDRTGRKRPMAQINRVGGKAARLAHRTLGVIEVTTKVVAVATGLVFGAAVFLGVVYRYVFVTSFPYATELPRVLFPWFIMMGATLAASRGEHLQLEVVTARLPRLARLALLVVTSVAVIFSFWVFTEVAIAMLPNMHRASTPLLSWPVSVGFASVPLGLGGIALCVALRLVVALFDATDGDPAGPSGPQTPAGGW